MTVGEMLSRMSAAELTEWMAFYKLEPFGDERADLRAGVVAATIVNVHRTSKNDPIAQPMDFMPLSKQEDDPIKVSNSRFINVIKEIWGGGRND